MTADTATIVELLRAHERDLRALGAASLSLFGSAARGQVRAESDIDIAVRLDAARTGDGFAYFGRLETLRAALERLLGRPVDLVAEPVRRAALRRAIDKDRVLAFG